MPTVEYECVRARFPQQLDSEHPSVPLAGAFELLPFGGNKVFGASASFQTVLDAAWSRLSWNQVLFFWFLI